MIGATPEGKKELVGFHVGRRESAQSWRELLVDLKARGLAVAPEVAVGDGALGFWKALNEVFPGTRHQRCWVPCSASTLMSGGDSQVGRSWPLRRMVQTVASSFVLPGWLSARLSVVVAVLPNLTVARSAAARRR